MTIAFSAGVPVAVTGPSGSGKSALCFVLAGAVEPTQGSVLFEGRPISPVTREEIGLILQVHGLVSGLTAIENVALPLQARRVQPRDVRDWSSERSLWSGSPTTVNGSSTNCREASVSVSGSPVPLRATLASS